MSIKADSWIRRMAREHEMITPFIDGQIHKDTNHRVVSYGLSSY